MFNKTRNKQVIWVEERDLPSEFQLLEVSNLTEYTGMIHSDDGDDVVSVSIDGVLFLGIVLYQFDGVHHHCGFVPYTLTAAHNLITLLVATPWHEEEWVW